jgi:hypothetical protein
MNAARFTGLARTHGWAAIDALTEHFVGSGKGGQALART